MLSILGLVAVSALDAGSPLITDWAQHPTYTLHAHVTCEQPDAGIFVTRFQEPHWFALGGDCDFSPLTCRAREDRDEVFRQLDAGTLRFAEPAVTVQPDAEGWVTLPVHAADALRVECGGLVEVFGAEAESIHAVSLAASTSSGAEMPPDVAQLLVINPFIREVRRVTPAKFAELPERIRVGAWIAAQRDTGEWSEPVLPGGSIGDFPPAEPRGISISRGTDWGVDGGTPTLIMVDAPGISPAQLTIVVENPNTHRAISVKDTHANGARFLLPPGEWEVTVFMAGARTERRRVTIGATPQDIRFTLSPGFSGRVVDEAGRPVEGACVSSTEGGYGYCRAWSDRDGRFALRDLDTSWARAEHARLGATEKVPVMTGQPITLKLRARNKLTVRVPPINQKPAHGWLAIDPGEGSQSAWEGAPFVGDVVIANLEPGAHELLIGAPGYATQRIKLRVPQHGNTTVRVPRWAAAR